MIPSYYSRINYIEEEEIKYISDIKSRYKRLIVFSLILTLIIIFFDFIVLNLYKDLCCQMDTICNITFKFINNLCICIKDIISRVICNSNNEEDEEIKEIIQESKIKKKEVNDLKEEIKNLLSEHINLIADSQIN
jgi:cell shape-determining protein MreC